SYRSGRTELASARPPITAEIVASQRISESCQQRPFALQRLLGISDKSMRILLPSRMKGQPPTYPHAQRSDHRRLGRRHFREASQFSSARTENRTPSNQDRKKRPRHRSCDWSSEPLDDRGASDHGRRL